MKGAKTEEQVRTGDILDIIRGCRLEMMAMVVLEWLRPAGYVFGQFVRMAYPLLGDRADHLGEILSDRHLSQDIQAALLTEQGQKKNE